jgi:hypothetical protein
MVLAAVFCKEIVWRMQVADFVQDKRTCEWVVQHLANAVVEGCNKNDLSHRQQLDAHGDLSLLVGPSVREEPLKPLLLESSPPIFEVLKPCNIRTY